MQSSLESKIKFLESLFMHSPVAMCVLKGPTYNLSMANASFLNMFLLKAENIIDRPVTEVFPEIHGQGFIEIFDHVYGTGESTTSTEMPGYIRLEDGSIKRYFINFTCQVIRNLNGDVEAILAMGLDVTDQVGARRKVLESETLYQLASRATRDAIWDWNLKTNKVRWNEAILTEYGYPDETMMTDVTFWYDNVHVDDRDRVVQGIRRAIESGEANWSAEYRFRQSSGNYLTVFDRGYVTHDESGKAIRMIGAMQDITSLRESQSQFKVIFDQSLVGVVQTDLEGRLVLVNDHFCRIVGRSREELLQMTMMEITHSEDLPESLVKFRNMIETGENFAVEKRYIKPDGRLVWVHNAVSLIRDSSGVPRCAVALSQDISKRKQVEEALNVAVKEAQLANQEKTRFLAHMSHEIRTPLGVIQGFSDLALEDSVSAEDKISYLKTIKRNAQLLTKLLGEILDVSKVEAGKIEIEKVRFSLLTIIEEVLSFLDLQAKEKGIALRFRLESYVPEYVQSDPMRIRQILINLVGNAIKFTDQGAVVVSLRTLPAEDSISSVCLLFSVTDTGIGLSEDQKKRIFKPFGQADSSMARKYGGSGLGLVLSKRLAQALGGDLKLLRSEIGKGSVFTFNVDVAIAAEDVRALETSEPNLLAGGRLKDVGILVVEDSLDNRILISQYLKSTGAKVEFATDGREGIEMARQKKYDLILMDIQMPIMDGYKATEELRKLGHRTPILALTAHALREERDRALESGFDDYLTKPLNRAVLIDTIAGHVH